MAAEFFSRLLAGARFYRQLKHPAERVTNLSAIVTALASKGWWLLTFHHINHYTMFNRSLRNPVWWMARILEPIGRYLCAVMCRAEMLGDVKIPGAVFLSDRGYFMIGALAIGEGTVIHHQVTMGMAVANGKADRPVIGKNVWIGPNCVIAGGLEVGDGATILPGSCLTFSIPPRAVAGGNPARILRKEFDNAELRRSLVVVTELPAPTEKSA
jgi:acetyltransferase-like isoleucine patch superfamily enzyme